MNAFLFKQIGGKCLICKYLPPKLLILSYLLNVLYAGLSSSNWRLITNPLGVACNDFAKFYFLILRVFLRGLCTLKCDYYTAQQRYTL